VVALAAVAGLGVDCRPPPEEPRLALLLVVDQLRADRLDPALPGGLGRLVREGRVFRDAVIDHAVTETCPGHVAASTGRHPGPVGVPGNVYIDRSTGESIYCVDDPTPGSRVIGVEVGRSPRAIEVEAIGDWLKLARPGARVFSISAKDRAAISLGGQHPDAAYWLERRSLMGFTTSAWYRSGLPEWVQKFNGSGAGGFVGGLPAQWEHPSGAPPNGARPDEYEREIDRYARVSPHPLADADRGRTLEQLWVTPYLDEVTLDFARALIEHEGLGQDDVPDLLAISLSAIDLVGHYYGPWSQESREALLRLDRALGEFLRFVEARVGRGGVVIGMTSDHGVLPIPEWLAESGLGRCPIRGGRVDSRGLRAALESSLEESFGRAGSGPWVVVAGLHVGINRARAAANEADPEAVVGRVKAMLEAQPVVERVWTAAEIAGGGGGQPFAALYAHSDHPERGGDLVIQTAEDCLVSSYPGGTSHGTPYLYDRAVPLVFFGPGVEAGTVRGAARTVDLAPTLAGMLGVPTPAELDGEPLSLR
jgi:hypothetical protein